MKRHVVFYFATFTLLTLSFQNCGVMPNFNQGRGFGQGVTESASISPVVVAKDFMTTIEKSVGVTSTKMTTVGWDLAKDLADGPPLTEVSMTVSISKFVPPDGSADTYFISKVTMKTGSKPIHIKGVHLWFNGVKYDTGTTFTGIDMIVAAAKTMILSSSTLVYQLPGKASATDKLALSFDLAWPDGEAPPSPDPVGPPVVINPGIALYETSCAGCHGALGGSEKRGASATKIKTAIASVSYMIALRGKLTDTDIQNIANALQ
jgi:hypothetical protein